MTIENEPKLTDDPSDVVTRRAFLLMLTQDEDALPALAESMEKPEIEVARLAIRSLAAELVGTSLKLEELSETVAALEVGIKVNGAMLAGLIGMDHSGYAKAELPDNETMTIEQVNDLDDETKVQRFNLIAYRTGAAIRAASGLVAS